ncbi:cytosolic phospholipase A2 delta-like isoform X2 [Hyla sarda]|uniref:cytosolic phospholipase A2 delta-like isoform X2 n=1 Tax=Hyla sarda TaxID=327740 RepID=UPI0024C41A4A|nr:cytosolic phospholipase A2 delta-like isoform X2 [Hyla sarda]XP_056401837.1 cytosolic phospholipase A2 delta-like isoform X2 [Hyla sarda]
MARRRSAISYHEESGLSLLTVKVVRAQHIPWADLMSHADCYVCLWLPTSTNKILKTRTVSDTSDPLWNETFQYTICNNVKNVLHLMLHDEDVITGNDLLYTVSYDVGKIRIGETKQKTFCLKPDGPEILQVEFSLTEFQGYCERLITNGVIVSREMTCLDICVDKQRIPMNLQGKQLILSVEDSCENECRMELSPCTGTDHMQTCRFHYLKRWDPKFTAIVEGADNQSIQVIPVKLLHMGEEKKILLSTVPVFTNCWGIRCFLPLRWIQPRGSSAICNSKARRIPRWWSPLTLRKCRRPTCRYKTRPLEVKLKAKDCTDKLDVRLGFSLCDEEKLYLSKRRKVVAETLKRVLKLDRDLEDHEIPVIAVTTTGGGVRAMTSLYGTLAGLKKLGLLDCVTYITGASGSTWSMSKLYEDPNWSHKDLCGPIEDACRQLTKSKGSAFSFERLAFYRDELTARARMGYRTSFTDLWGLVIESMFSDGLNGATLSEQRKALAHGQNPLPLCLAMNVKSSECSTLDYKEWCEFSPYEVGLLKYGAFIRAEDFGSEFFMGRLTKALPESRICYLQALWSNIFSVNLMDAWFAAKSSENFWHKFTRDNVFELEEEEALRKRRALSGLPTRVTQPASEFSRTMREILTNRPLDGEHHNFLRGLQMHKGYCTHHGFCGFDDTELDNSPNKLTPFDEDLCLVDSAYYINASFPPLLRAERKVDVLLSFDYGLTEKFMSVERTQDYCKVHNLHFPKIEVSEEEKANPRECYLFPNCDDPRCPTVLHFPLVNDTFRQFKHPGVERLTDQEKEEGIVDLGEKTPYKLLNLTYSKEDFDKLINLTEYNVENNEKMILQVLREAIECKKNHKPRNDISV